MLHLLIMPYLKKLHQYTLESFETESGRILKHAEAAVATWGQLNEEHNNVVLICHALTGNQHADDWFSGFFGDAGFISTDKHYVICINLPGSCYGSVGPWSEDPKTGEPYRGNFPRLTIRDMAHFQSQILNLMGIDEVMLVIGGSMGGMVALEMSITDSRIKKTCCMAMGKSHSPWAIGISHAQRMALYADPKWNNGNYIRNDPPSNGLAAARAMAMITYRTPENYATKFGRNMQSGADLFQVESYLQYQGEKLATRFDALSYDILTRAMDTHDVSRGRGAFEQVLGQVKHPALVIGISSDKLYPPEEQQELSRLLGNAVHREVHSPYGHDAFLLEFEQMNQHILSFLKS